MFLTFDGRWRFTPPRDGQYRNQQMPAPAVEGFFALVLKMATQADRQSVVEHFKRHFCAAAGSPYVRSSGASWAETDLRTRMDQAASNSPVFIDAFYDACETLVRQNPRFGIPSVDVLNQLLIDHDVGYQLRPPDLLLRETEGPLVGVPDRPLSLAEKAIELLQESLKRSEELLSQGHGREAVQESLWLLETVATAFRGKTTRTGTVEGKYFNEIVNELRHGNRGTTLDRVLEWTANLHGYLSSPTGGGVRHGLDLKRGLLPTPTESRLFCNLIRSYLGYLIAEHAEMPDQGQPQQ